MKKKTILITLAVLLSAIFGVIFAYGPNPDIEKLKDRISNIRMGRLAVPDDIAGACLLLASDYAGYISGQVIPVDGCTIM